MTHPQKVRLLRTWALHRRCDLRCFWCMLASAVHCLFPSFSSEAGYTYLFAEQFACVGSVEDAPTGRAPGSGRRVEPAEKARGSLIRHHQRHLLCSYLFALRCFAQIRTRKLHFSEYHCAHRPALFWLPPLYRYRANFVTGGFMVLWALFCSIVFKANGNLMAAYVALGAGLALLCSSIWALLTADRLLSDTGRQSGYPDRSTQG